MSDFYTEAQCELQAEFATTALAERLEAAIVSDALTPDQTDFIQAQHLFFLSTVDADGFPSCSYKGGAQGFVRVIDNNGLVFPSYDGNVTKRHIHPIAATAKIGLLFVDFEQPARLRVRGDARLVRDGALIDAYAGAELVVDLRIERVWQNCPRYVHRMTTVEPSRYVPGKDGRAPFAPWKRIDAMQDVINATDRAEAKAQGLISAEEYERMIREE